MTAQRNDLLRRVLKAAAKGGPSHRMLIHHFGSREGVLAAVVEAIERNQNERLGDCRMTRRKRSA